MRAIWSPRARAELRDYVVYFRERNAAAARRASAELTEVGRKLGRNPYLGRPGQREGEREFSVADWHKVIVYKVSANQIVISPLRDTRMQNTD